MENESCSWSCLAELLTDVGANVLRNLLCQNISTSCLSEYKSFWLKTIGKHQRQFNFCSRLFTHLCKRFCKLDHATQEVLKPLIESMRSKGTLTLARQVQYLYTWLYNIREKLGSCRSDVQEELLSWEKQIQDEKDKLSSLLGVFKDWNTCFLSLWSSHQSNVNSKMQAQCDDFVYTRRSSLSKITITSKDDLQTFSKTFGKDAQSIMQMCQTTLMEPWINDIEALVNSLHVPEQTHHYTHILKDFVSEVNDYHPQLKDICKSDTSLDSWYKYLTQIQVSWQKEVDDTVGSPTEIEMLAKNWQLHLSDCPSYRQIQLETFIHSEAVKNTLFRMRKHKILTDGQVRKLTKPAAVRDLSALDTTCLLILLRKNGILQPPECGFQADISDSDLSTGADLLRLESYINDMISSIQKPFIPKERFHQVEDVLSRLASHGGNDFQSKIKTDMDKIKTCFVEDRSEGNLERVVSSCARAILADVSGLSLSGRYKTIAARMKSYLEILNLLLQWKWRVRNPSKEIENGDVGDWTSEADTWSKECEKYLKQFISELLEYFDAGVTDKMDINPDFDDPLTFKHMWTKYVKELEARIKSEEGREQMVRKRRNKSEYLVTFIMTIESPFTLTRKSGEKTLIDKSFVVSALHLSTAEHEDSDFGWPIACVNMTFKDSHSEKMDIVPKTVKRKQEREETVTKRIKESHDSSITIMTTNSLSASAGQYNENLLKESDASMLYCRTEGYFSEKGKKVLEMLRNEDSKGIKDLLRERQIPTKNTTKAAVRECGYNECVKLLLSGISDLLKEAIPNSTRVWCGYRLHDRDCPVFVVTLKDRNCIFDRDKIPIPCNEYDITVRHKHDPNKEERTIFKLTGRKIVTADDAAKIYKCIEQNTLTFMREHSNLSIITASPVKASGFLNNQLVLADTACLVFYVPVKGIIPIGETEFPGSIDGIFTDVREGEFVLFGRHNANKHYSRPRMGCRVSRPETKSYGTLGGFVDLPGNKIGCLTAAHVVLTEDEIVKYTAMDERARTSLNASLKHNDMYYMYQPEKKEDSIPFGRVSTIALQEGDIYSSSVDAAIIEITDYDRIPKSGSFPDGDFGEEDTSCDRREKVCPDYPTIIVQDHVPLGFTTDNPMLYATGQILDQIPSSQRPREVIKFGNETGITRGILEWQGTSARLISEAGNYCFPIMHKQMIIIPTDPYAPITDDQMEIATTGFADKGDSGALVFLSSDANVNDLYAIGMVVGGNSTNYATIITPITAIFQELALPVKRFKAFPNVLRLLEEHSVTLKTISESINRLDQKFDNTIASLRQELKEILKESVSENRNANT